MAVFREAQYCSLEGLCQAARPLQERIIVMGCNKPTYSCEMYNPLQGSWERMDAGMGALPDGCLFCAGDGCLFAIEMPGDQRAGSVQTRAAGQSSPRAIRSRGAAARFGPTTGAIYTEPLTIVCSH